MQENKRGGNITVGFIGSAGVPNRYGGFESFLENCGPLIAKKVSRIYVTCDANKYSDYSPEYNGMKRLFVSIPANGGLSIIHDLVAFVKIFRLSSVIVVLGNSGAPWYLFFRLVCEISGKKLITNIAGLEWRRTKFSVVKRCLLRVFDFTVQMLSHKVVYDNDALYNYLVPSCRKKAVCIGYSGDHIIRYPAVKRKSRTALTICRIEPENNIEMLIAGAMQSGLDSYTIVGNWTASKYGRDIIYKESGNPRLKLLNPLYESDKISVMREECEVYLHGHSVGGTNPSLVEILFYDCCIFCFDVEFNRATASESVQYFRNSDELAEMINGYLTGNCASIRTKSRLGLRKKYSGEKISSQYFSLLQSVLSL